MTGLLPESAARHQKIEISVTVRIEKHGCGILAILVGFESRLSRCVETAGGVSYQESSRLAGHPSDKQVSLAVGVRVAPRHTTCSLRELPRKERFAGEIIECRLGDRDVIKQVCSAEQRRARAARFRRCNQNAAAVRRLSNRVESACFEIGVTLTWAARPVDGQRINSCGASKAEVQDGFAGGQPGARQRQITNLRGASGLNTDGGADPKAITKRAFEPDAGAVPRSAPVTVDAKRCVGIVYDQIEPAIVVEICRSTSEAHSQASESPRNFSVLETELAHVSEHHVCLPLKRLRGPERRPLW